MKYEVYLDTFFITQLIMDYCVLRLTVKTMKLRTSRLKLVFAAFTGALGSCLMFVLPNINLYVKFGIITAIIGLLMSWIAFRIRGIKQYISVFFMLIAMTFLLGGVTGWIISRIKGEVPFCFRLILIFIIYGLFLLCIKLYREQESLLLPVTLSIQDEEGSLAKVSVVALTDTGNRLRESETGMAVCILEKGVCDHLSKVDYTVPYHTLGNEEDQMYAQRIEGMTIHTKEGDVSVKDVMLAFYPGQISKRGAYHMILHPEYLKEEQR